MKSQTDNGLGLGVVLLLVLHLSDGGRFCQEGQVCGSPAFVIFGVLAF